MNTDQLGLNNKTKLYITTISIVWFFAIIFNHSYCNLIALTANNRQMTLHFLFTLFATLDKGPLIVWFLYLSFVLHIHCYILHFLDLHSSFYEINYSYKIILVSKTKLILVGSLKLTPSIILLSSNNKVEAKLAK